MSRCDIPVDLLAYADQRAARAREHLEALVNDEVRSGYGAVGDSLGIACLTEIIQQLLPDERSVAEALAVAVRRLAAQ